MGLEVLHFRGRTQVMEGASRLHGLAKKTGQDDALLHLDYLLSVPYFGHKRPHLLVWGDVAGETHGAAFVLEHRVFGVPTRVFVPIDDDGELTVIAQPQDRMEAAKFAAEHLLSSGALSVILTLASTKTAVCGEEGGWIAKNTRELRRTLALKATLDETLLTIGARSRRNLRSFGRKVISTLGATFVQNAEISEGDFIALNHVCLYPVPEWVAKSRYRTVQRLKHTFLSGLQAKDGTWLSLVGGRRDGKNSIIDWQMNRTGLPTYSIGTAMRFFHINDEVERGMRFLRFSGGTPHSIQNAFLHETATDLLWTRAAIVSKTLRVVCRLLRRNNVISAMFPSSVDAVK